MSQRGNLASSVFVGRTPELRVLREALGAAGTGTGGIVLLVGEPGIGKSRIAEEFARQARDGGAEVLAGRCFEGPGAPPFWPWLQVVRSYVGARDAATLGAELGAGAGELGALVPELAERVPGLAPPAQASESQVRFRLFDTLTRAFARAAARRPVAIVLDDLHGADPSSLLLLQFLGREVRRAGIVVVGTLRHVALEPGHPLAATLGELVREQVSQRLELTGLGAGEVGELMARMGGEEASPALAAAVHDRTEGNPLYVTEVVRMLLAQGGFAAAAGGRLAIPATVRMAIGRHLGALSAGAHETLTLAALFGRDFRADVVARAGGRPVDEVLAHVDEAVGARLVAPLAAAPGRYRFAHALFGETLVEALGEVRRVGLHRRAADALAADPHADDLVPEIAHHAVAAGPGGDPQAAVAWARRAGDRAFGVLAYEEAAEWYRRALTALGWTGVDDPPLRGELLLGLGETLKRAGSAAEGKAAFEKAAAVGRSMGSPEILTRAALGFAPAIAWGEQPAPDAAVVGLLEEAVASWRGRESSLHAQALARLGLGLLFGEPARRDALISAGVEMARRLGDAASLRFALVTFLGCYQDRFAFRRRLEIATEIVRLAEPARDLEALAIGRLWRGVHLMETGDVAGSAAELLLLTAVVEELRQPVWRWHLCLQRTIHDVLKGRFDEAERMVHEAFELSKGLLMYAGPAYFVGQGLLLGLLRGDPDPTPYRALYELHPDPVALSPIAWVEAELGRLDEARKLVERFAADEFAVVRHDLLPVIGTLFLSEAIAALDDSTHAAQLVDIIAPHARHWIVWAEGAPLGPAAHPLGLLLRTAGRLDEAAEHFEFAIADSRRVGAPPYLARALYEYAVLLRKRATGDDAARAQALLAEARRVAEAIGMQGLVRKIDARQTDAIAVDAAERAFEPVGSSVRTLFQREGDYWVVSYAGRTIRLRDVRGLRYLAALLANPGREFHAGDLVGGELVGVEPRAGTAYRERLRDLEAELAEAERANDLGKAARYRTELAALRDELIAAARGRRSRTHGERARLTVTKGIGAVLSRIDAEHPELAAHLRATVRRGYFCAYVPDPRHPIRWEC